MNAMDNSDNSNPVNNNRTIGEKEWGYQQGLKSAMDMIDAAIKNPATDVLPTKMILQVLKAAMLQEIDDFEDLT